MERLVKAIEDIRARLDGLRRHSLKETPTRTIVIDPLLQALGWDVRDPDEVQLEYPTVDGKSVDYALKLNGKPVLLVEAKGLEDPLKDVKDVTQVVGYAANDGIAWCILTSGIIWKVYSVKETCQAPDKLMFEVDLDPGREEMPIAELAKKLWRFSRDEMAKGTLDALGEQVFTDGKVRKALSAIMSAPPRALLNLVRNEMGDSTTSPQRIKESLVRIWREAGMRVAGDWEVPRGKKDETTNIRPRGRKGKKAKKDYGEEHHVSGKSKEALELYAAVDRVCLSLKPGGIQKRFLAKHISYDVNEQTFCILRVQQCGLRLYLWVEYSRLVPPRSFARDVSNAGYWRGAGVELAIGSLSQVDAAKELICQSFQGRQ
jgi:predicted transport protein